MEEREILSWQAPEYIFRKKHGDWFFAITIMTVALLIVAIFEKNILFGIVVLLGSFTILMYGVRKPHMLTITLREHGIQIGDRLFRYDSLQSFWIGKDTEDDPTLIIVPIRALASHMKISLKDVDVDVVQEKLQEKLPEEPYQESLADRVTQWLWH